MSAARARWIVAFGCVLAFLYSAGRTAAGGPTTRTLTIHYRAHDGARRAAVVLLPSWYGSPDDAPLPLVISPHGRGVSGRTNAAIWGDLPGQGGFAVINPDGQGRELERLSWGYRGQIDDLARMPQILHSALPWVRIDPTMVYAVGGSMGGQESLLLLAQHPRLLAGVAAFDAAADFSLQYRNLARVPCGGACRRMWKGPEGRGLRRLVRTEVGGTPRQRPFAYARRSPLTYARRLARSCVPVQLWWSTEDRVVRDQRMQSERLFRRMTALNRRSPVTAFIGTWTHSHEMRNRLPFALAGLGLLSGPEPDKVPGVHVLPAPADAC